jgi:phenylpropionate dioxygenase-like ring-hydroxylating dioxygenase large terminal subunit
LQTERVLTALAERADEPGRWETLPPQAYCSDEVFELEVERVFRPGWLNVGHVSQVPNPGDIRAIDLLGEPLVVTRDRGGELHVLSRVCAHRWMEVCQSGTCGNVPSLQCPYHLWSYSLDGTLRGAPEMDRTPGFDKADHGLTRHRHEIWQGFIYVNLDGTATPTTELWGDLSAQLSAYRLADWHVAQTTDWGVSAWDWKVFIDNGECYHHAGTHPETLETFMPGRLSYDLPNNRDYTLVVAPVDEPHLVKGTDGGRDMPASEPPIEGLEPWQRTGLGLAYPFPNYAIALLPSHGYWYEVRPLSAGRIHLLTHVLAAPHLIHGDGFAGWVADHTAGFAAVHGEDIAVCEGVQRGAAAAGTRAGQFSHLEGHNRGFADWYARQMTG